MTTASQEEHSRRTIGIAAGLVCLAINLVATGVVLALVHFGV